MTEIIAIHATQAIMSNCKHNAIEIEKSKTCHWQLYCACAEMPTLIIYTKLICNKQNSVIWTKYPLKKLGGDL